jgi:hypothetical protein
MAKPGRALPPIPFKKLVRSACTFARAAVQPEPETSPYLHRITDCSRVRGGLKLRADPLSRIGVRCAASWRQGLTDQLRNRYRRVATLSLVIRSNSVRLTAWSDAFRYRSHVAAARPEIASHRGRSLRIQALRSKHKKKGLRELAQALPGFFFAVDQIPPNRLMSCIP